MIVFDAEHKLCWKPICSRYENESIDIHASVGAEYRCRSIGRATNQGPSKTDRGSEGKGRSRGRRVPGGSWSSLRQGRRRGQESGGGGKVVSQGGRAEFREGSIQFGRLLRRGCRRRKGSGGGGEVVSESRRAEFRPGSK